MIEYSIIFYKYLKYYEFWLSYDILMNLYQIEWIILNTSSIYQSQVNLRSKVDIAAATPWIKLKGF